MDQAFPVTVSIEVVRARRAQAVRIKAPAGLDRPARLVARNPVCRHPFFVQLVVGQRPAVRVVSGEVEEIHAGEDDQEPAQQGDRIHGIGGVEPLKEDERGTQGGSGKRNIVEGVHAGQRSATGFAPCLLHLHRGRELVQCLVEVIHLCQNAEPGYNGKDICRRMGELIVAPEGELQRNAKRLDGHDRDGADSGADRDVYQRVLLSVHGRDAVDHDGGENRDSEAIDEEACLISLCPYPPAIGASVPG